MKTKLETYSCMRPNEELHSDIRRIEKSYIFVGTGKRNKGKKYREYALTPEDAAVGICTYHRLLPQDIQLSE